MRTWMLVTVLLAAAMLPLAGCGSTGTAAGVGTAAGFLASETVKGMKADLDKKKQELVALYNSGVEAGEEAATLEQIEQKIKYIQYAKTALEQGESAVGTDWSDPEAVGGWIGALAALAYTVFTRRKLSTTEAKYTAAKRGMEAFMATNDPAIATSLRASVGAERAAIL